MSKEVTYKLNVETNSAVKEVDDLNKSLETTNDEVSGLKKSGKALQGLKKGAKGVAGGFRAMGTALKAAGIGLIIGALATLKELFEQNQRVVDLFNIAFETVSIAFSDFTTFIKENVGVVTGFFKSLFDDPVVKIKEFGDAIYNGVIARIKQGIEALGLFGKAIGKLFKGDFSGALETAKEGTKELFDVITGEEGGFEAVKETINDVAESVVDYAKATVEAATANVDLKKQAELAAVANQGLIEKYDLQAESLRQIRDDERLSIEDRKKANNDLLLVLDQQEKSMLKNAQIALRAAQAQLKKDTENIEFKKAVMEAENELAAVRAQVAGFRSEQQANDLALSKEELEMSNSKLEAENNLSIERKRFNAEQTEDDLERLQKQKEIDAEEKEIQTTRLQGIIDTANAGTQAKIDAEIALNEFLEQSRQQDLTRLKEIGEAKVAATQKINSETLASDEATTAARVSLEQALVNSTSSALSSIAQLAGEGTKIAKVAAIADIIIGTGVGFIQGLDIAQKSAKATGPAASVAFPIFYATQVAAVLSAAAQAKNILSKAKGPSAPSISAPSISGGSSGGGASASQAPSFNVVGQSGFNQVAGALGQQQPVQAYVVAGNVTTAQQLQNNTITQATF
ncbi:hypothetical protein [uncultured Polaribacter sp.]|jgi:hypothetical protein|uniref:hypothetical protein n=1 Tax=uncultured Polaribacter sp. TaxID=174711 RepID=UPI00259AFCBD|nr:hypothetical protein [uncultured Polaribacter sp.]